MKKISLKRSTPNLRNITNPIMILQAKHFICSSCFDWTKRFYSDFLDRLERATIYSRQAERFSRDSSFLSLFLSLGTVFSCLLFLASKSECKGYRNEEGTSVHNSKTSSPSASSSTRLFYLRLVMAVALLCSFEFLVALVAAGTKRKGILGVSPRGRSSLSDITFILFRASSLPRRRSFLSILSSSSRFVSSRLYRSRVRDQNWSQSLRYRDGILSRSTISRIRSRIHLLACRQHKVSHCYELENKVWFSISKTQDKEIHLSPSNRFSFHANILLKYI